VLTEEEIREDLRMTPEDFLAIVTHMILDGQQRYIALCAAAPQKMPARDELLQIVNGAVETIVRAADEVPDAERGEALTKAATIIVNLSFARLGSVLESQFRPHPVARETAARRNLAAALQDAGLVGYTIEEVRREEDGYTVRVSKAGHMFARSDLDEAVLEDASSDTRRRLAEAARRELDRG
jgi:hypothetical protein